MYSYSNSHFSSVEEIKLSSTSNFSYQLILISVPMSQFTRFTFSSVTAG